MGPRSGGVIARYRAYLPVSDATPVVSLGEGGTPLIHSPRLSELVGRGCEVFVKYEGLNPTGSFKDRGMTVAVSKALERGAQTLICASTGNTSASAAAYAARAGMRCAVVLPAGKIASGKMVQAFAYGAHVVAIEGNFDQALEIVRALGTRDDFAIVNSINPDRIAGQKTAAFEIVDELGDAPDLHLLPVGNAGNITAYWAGYQQYHAAGRGDAVAAHDRVPGGGRGANLSRENYRKTGNRRDCHSDRKSGELVAGESRAGGIARSDRYRERRRDSRQRNAGWRVRKEFLSSRPARLPSQVCFAPVALWQAAASPRPPFPQAAGSFAPRLVMD